MQGNYEMAADEKNSATSLASFKNQNKGVQDIFSAVGLAIPQLPFC